MDEATDRLIEEAKHAHKIKEQTNNCYMYMCIVIELIVLAILVAVILMQKK